MSDSRYEQQRDSTTGHPETRRKDKPRQKPRRAPKKQDTHFLCFPLVNDVSVPQLAKSLAHFRNITSKKVHDDSNIRNDSTPSRDDTGGTVLGRTLAPSGQKLKIIGEEAFRPPGTYHLTLGVMDLSTPVQMKKALDLLQILDIEQMLLDATADTINSIPAQASVAQQKTHQRGQEQEHGQSSEPHSIPQDPKDIRRRQSEEVDVKGDSASAQGLSSLTRPISPPSPATEAEPSTATAMITTTTTTTPPTASRSTHPITINLTGLSTFPNATSARVFYAKPHDPTSRLHTLAVSIRQQFRNLGLITESRPLVLHATVANLRYAVQKANAQRRQMEQQNGNANDSRNNDKGREGQVDARKVVEVFDQNGGCVDLDLRQGGGGRDDGGGGSNEVHNLTQGEFIWAEGIVIDQLAICRLGATESDDPVLGSEYPPIATRSVY